mgnify:FL=1
MIISTDIEFAVGRRDPETLRSYRAFKSRQAQLRERPTIAGCAHKFLSLSERPKRLASDGRTALETVLPGAFARSLAGAENITALINHEESWVVGQTEDYSLKLWEDDVGLQYRVAFDSETRFGRLLYNAISLGHFSGMSLGWRFDPRRDIHYSRDTRVFLNATILEISFLLPKFQPQFRGGTAHLDVPISVLRRRLEHAL